MRKQATCHPDELNYARGKCKRCYQKDKWHNDPEYRASRLKKDRAWYHKNDENKTRRRSHSKEWYLKNKKRVQEQKRQNTYGLTPEQYKKLYDSQQGICAICKTNPAQVVDHDHETGLVRGLLCSNCNLALGGYEVFSKRNLLASVEAYLEFLR